MKRLGVLVMLVSATVLGFAPAGWKWGSRNDARAGWSWNADIASVSDNTVTLISRDGNTLTLSPVEGADPVVGDEVTVVEAGLVWDANTGGTVDQPLGWTWNG